MKSSEIKVDQDDLLIFESVEDITSCWYVAARNEQAHETEEEFAELISEDDFMESHAFDQWKDIFPVAYGRTVEALRAQKQARDNLLTLLNEL